jgi:glycosyltransferase involved in cell wall biosynthesis
MKNVAIVYRFFALYRLPILKKLVNDKDINFYFISDFIAGNDVKGIDFAKESEFNGRHFKVSNIWVKKFLWQRGLIKILLNERFDTVIFLGEDRTLSTWLAMILMRMRNTKVYLWSHGIYGREALLKKKIRVLFNKIPDGVFLYNNRAKELLIKEKVNKDRLEVIYNSLDIEEIEKYRKLFNNKKKSGVTSLFSDPTLPIAFCISRINESKRIDMLIEAVDLLNKASFRINCLIIGDGKEELVKLKELVDRKGLNSQILFVGSLYNESDISAYILSSDICVCPGAIGLTAIHSLSYGIPVITHDNFSFQGPEFESIIPNVTGNFYKEGNVFDLSLKMKDCIESRRNNKEKSIRDCLNVIYAYYNPDYQMRVFKDKLM